MNATFGPRLAAYLIDLPLAFLAVMIPLVILMKLIIASRVWVPAAGDPQACRDRIR